MIQPLYRNGIADDGDCIVGVIFEKCVQTGINTVSMGYDELLDQFSSVEEIAINRSIIDSARDLMADYQVNSYDAIHAATALAFGASMLATMDAGFLKLAALPSLTVRVIR